jgi:hypothetical protein
MNESMDSNHKHSHNHSNGAEEGTEDVNDRDGHRDGDMDSDSDSETEMAVTWAPAASRGKTGLVYDERMLDHFDLVGDHPECPERVGEIYAKLVRDQLACQCQRVPAR